MTDSRAVVVTGASTGIGLAIARVLVARGVHVFGSVRRQADADHLASELGPGVSPLLFDVTDTTAVRAAVPVVSERLGGRTLWGLVNNAGIGLGGPLLHQSLDELRRVLEVNVVGVLATTQAFAPLLGTDRTRTGSPGRIINMSSVAGRMSAPFMGAYAASKHALEGLSHSLRRELVLYGIDVILVNPGSVVTPIWDKVEADDPTRYAGTDYAPYLTRFLKAALASGRSGLEPDAIGQVVWTALSAGRPRTSYPVMRNRLTSWTIPLALPARLLDTLIARRLGMPKRG